ncbi:hypothetical protein ACFQPI_20850 [Insolitispirillum peregrinum]|uniref:hypothetical protein n=1 Tax=Insolitispirillum peregrinum TaxID=80876 RepID=UPI0036119200
MTDAHGNPLRGGRYVVVNGKLWPADDPALTQTAARQQTSQTPRADVQEEPDGQSAEVPE